MLQVLDIKQLTMDFGGLRAIDDVDLEVRQGEIVALIGPNGAGKTTFFNCVTGVYEPTGGVMMARRPGKNASVKLNKLKPNVITEHGLARTFQNIRLFQNMTVLENVMVARHCRTRSGILGAIFRNAGTRREEQETVDFSYGLLEKVGLQQHVNDLARELPYGAQRRLEIARALATEPFLLLLDEPAAGMNPRETSELDALITRIRDDEGISILLIEHDMKLVMSISQRIYVMDYGRLIAQGTPREIAENPNVIKAYLGETFDA
ncbi:MAG: ABC transporter ATP-binding protein [Desulfomonilia bacterium]|jgi:branched-chain amino acid transport system ATP-binding protein|uniref:Leucine/isoleucine/valine transporter subunit ATP-binding component of ABC superfamily n=1 Tax=anaerobic digester metagenome TaxID=1263854 RepID=A0A485LZV8_9ZZZZ|nr:ABC transporter ATP-binding protein [Pseudomonadota bacterium]HON38353.1 ABC transporter ATP-binding protein [Deltaproteobacteria bacterium]HRS56511.1 ABC transporter ATP-binding protein [Desulfomonilia bacterium]HPD21664.1 ABC transporter ATP-binding protein [Deltaproteobacteria bacterium]HPX18322.1 ABC transporter ATP-binding protein [Deltaproteobacteria bacterium]